MALHQLRETESQEEQDKFLHDVIENDPNILKSKEKLQVLHKDRERITRLVKTQEDGARAEVSSGKRKEVTSHGEVLTEDGLINSEGEVQIVKRKDENAKKSKICYSFEQLIFVFHLPLEYKRSAKRQVHRLGSLACTIKNVSNLTAFAPENKFTLVISS